MEENTSNCPPADHKNSINIVNGTSLTFTPYLISEVLSYNEKHSYHTVDPASLFKGLVVRAFALLLRVDFQYNWYVVELERLASIPVQSLLILVSLHHKYEALRRERLQAPSLEDFLKSQ